MLNSFGLCDQYNDKNFNIDVEKFENYYDKYGFDYRQEYIISIKRSKANKIERELMKIAENYTTNEDILTSETIYEDIQVPKQLCYQVVKYYCNEFNVRLINDTQKPSMSLEYEVDIKEDDPLMLDQKRYENVFLVSMKLKVSVGFYVSSSCFQKQRWVWINGQTKKVIKVEESSLISICD